MTIAGRLNRSITIQRATITRDALNEPIKTWSDLVTVNAFRTDTTLNERTGERLRAQEIGAELMSRFRVYYSAQTSGVTAKDRIICDGQTFEILGVRLIGLHQEIEFSAVARSDV